MDRVNVRTAINSALSNHFAARRKYVINLLLSVPIIGNPGEVVNTLVWNQDPAVLRWCPLQNDSRRSVFTFGVPLPRGLVLCHPVFFYCV